MLHQLLAGLVALATLVSATPCLAAKLKPGDAAPRFAAQGVDGKPYTLKSIQDAKVKVICFTCNECPIATAYEERFIEFARKYQPRGVAFLAINVNYRETLEAMKQRAEDKGFTFPYAYDASGDSCRAFGATRTPYLFVFGADNKLVYQGAFDDSFAKPTRSFVEDAVKATLAGKAPAVAFTRAVGCAISPKLR